jgi:F-type H+-transporting ATPase subunit a
MRYGRFKSLLVAGFSVFLLLFSGVLKAQEQQPEKHDGFNANEVIFAHVLDAYEYHFLSYQSTDGVEHHVTIPLPVILYSPQRGFSVFSSSRFHHGEENYLGYKMMGNKIIPVKADGSPDPSVKVFDISMTRNVVQMILALTLLVFLLIKIAGKYKSGIGTTKAPTGFQNLMEPVITFVRDEVSIPCLGAKSDKYLPYLLTVFFFILINTFFGLIPGAANVTGNIAFTLVLGVISFIIITVSGN